MNGLDTQRPRTAAETLRVPVVVKGYTDIINPPGRSQLLAGVMLGVAFLVLLVACANATNRRKDYPARKALALFQSP